MNLKNSLKWFSLIVPISLALFSISRVWTVLPSIMGDEYIYSTQARNLPFAEHSYSNYLFSWFMGFTKYCGPEFYTCTKAINSVFFLATVALVLLIALRLLSFWQSIFVASIAALSPIAIPVSYFMPESMYFFMMTLAIWVALTISTKPNWWIWSSLGLVVGLASLVKPHAIFVAPAFLMFALFIQRNNVINLKKYSFFKSVLSYGLGFALGKFALGFVFAGSSGLRLFGGYGSPVEALTSAANREIGNSVPEEPLQSGLSILLQVGSTHVLAHLAAVFLLAGIPLLVGTVTTFRAISSKQRIEGDKLLSVLVVFITTSMILVVAVFEAYVTAVGDDHGDRLIMRYYEFLIPIFAVLGFTFANSLELGRKARMSIGALVTGFSMFFVIFYPVVFQKQFADSSTMPGISTNSALYLVLGLAVTSSVIVWIENPKIGAPIISWLVIPAVLVSSMLMSQSRLIETNGTAAYFDVAGKSSAEILSLVDGDKILVVGKSRTEVFTVKFWIDRANIRHYLVGEGSILREDLVSGVEYIVVLGAISIDIPSEVIRKGEGFTILKISNS